MGKLRTYLLVLLASFCAGALGDEVYLKNGDRLTGTVASVEPRRIRFESDMVGEVTIDLENVTRFWSQKPMVVLMEDGSTRSQQVVWYDNGVFHVGASTQPSTQPSTRPATQPATSPSTQPSAEEIAEPATQPAEQVGFAATRESTTAPADVSGVPGAGDEIKPGDFVRISSGSVHWNGSVSAGATLYRGNTDSEMATLAFDASRRSLHDRIESNGVYNYGREKNPDSGEKFVTADNLSLSGEYDYFVSRQQYIYAGGRVERDRMQDLYLRATPGAGVGHQWIESDETNINTEAGLAWVYERRTDPHAIDEYLAFRVAWHVDRKLNDRVSVVHNFEFLPRADDFSDNVMNADAGLKVGITGHLFTTFRVVLTYDSTPGDGEASTDVAYHALMGYQF